MKPLIRFAFLSLAVTACSHQEHSGSPIFDASAAEIQAAMGNSPSGEFYRRDQWQPVWSEASAKVLAHELSLRTRHGLERVSFLSDISNGAPATKETALTRAALAYATALANGVADPAKLYPIYTIPHPQPDLIAGLQQALADGRLSAWLESLAPRDGEYAALSKSYLSYRALSGKPSEAAPGEAPADRARALAVAMERRRWLVRNPPATRIDINTASAVLDYVRDGKLVDQRKVVTGQPGKETPQIEAPIFRLVANPTWTVPKSIASTELAKKSSRYLKRHHMTWKNGWIVQRSGPANSLGLVKFDMDDKYEIYLHDTPAKSMFALDERQQSHGCVRIEHALGFADMLAGQENIAAQWQRARKKRDETFVPLPQPIPVRMLYHPTFVARSGEVQFGEDIYDWDSPVAKLLGYDTAPGRRVIATVSDLGP